MVEAKTKQPEDKERSGSPRIGPVPVEIEGPVHVEPGNPGSPVKEQFQLRWAAPPARSFLGENQIHIWAALLDPPADELEQLFTTLAADERERAARFRFEHHRNRFIAGRGLLR